MAFEAVVNQGSVLILISFLTYINGLTDNLELNLKLFAFGTSVFLVVN